MRGGAISTRRAFALGSVGAVIASSAPRSFGQLSPRRQLGPTVEPAAGKTVKVDLIAAERPCALPCFGGAALPLWTFSEKDWLPVIRLDLGDRLEATLRNRLGRKDESTSIHWHGIRLPNDQDGVPFLVQPLVHPGESFRYAFEPPDTGTYFFHTHCNTAEQLGRGLEGLLIVDGDVTEPYDADVVLLMRDWHVDLSSGSFNPFFSLRGAGRAGSYGAVRSVNGATNPQIALPSGGDCRVRLINSDPTRIMRVRIDGAEAAVVAIDGAAIPPFQPKAIVMGPAMRADLVLRAPEAGKIARLVDDSGGSDVQLASFAGKGPLVRRTAFDPAPLRAPRIPQPDLGRARRFRLSLDRSEAGGLFAEPLDGMQQIIMDSICLSSKDFWTINDRTWPDRDHSRLPPPFATLEKNQTYIVELENRSQFAHPIHIHGHTFKFLRGSQQKLPPHFTDTVPLLPEEKVEVAFVADNPGDWMLHCHIIEHQETGMMTYFRVA